MATSAVSHNPTASLETPCGRRGSRNCGSRRSNPRIRNDGLVDPVPRDPKIRGLDPPAGLSPCRDPTGGSSVPDRTLIPRDCAEPIDLNASIYERQTASTRKSVWTRLAAAEPTHETAHQGEDGGTQLAAEATDIPGVSRRERPGIGVYTLADAVSRGAFGRSAVPPRTGRAAQSGRYVLRPAAGAGYAWLLQGDGHGVGRGARRRRGCARRRAGLLASVRRSSSRLTSGD